MIIAEIGMNHLGSFKNAKKYVEELVNCDIDAITIQIREQEYYRGEKEKYQLTDDEYTLLSQLIKNSGKKFGVAIADLNKIWFLDSIGAEFYKVIRNDINNHELMDQLLLTNKKIIVSTGMSSNEEIDKFVEKYFLTHKDKKNNKLVLNHTQLSHDPSDCNLLAIKSMKKQYGMDVSFGSHCENINVLYMSLCYSPCDILFYVKLDNCNNYPDDKHAIALSNVYKVSKNIKDLIAAPGDGRKKSMKNKIRVGKK